MRLQNLFILLALAVSIVAAQENTAEEVSVEPSTTAVPSTTENPSTTAESTTTVKPQAANTKENASKKTTTEKTEEISSTEPMEAMTEDLANTELPVEESFDVDVTTYLGTIKGLRQKVEGGGQLYTFLGIPYAQPPVGNKRFKPPTPVTAYGSLEAKAFRSECIQISNFGPKRGKIVGSEDCLFLNIFSPSLTVSKEALKPVMFWIHGGGFTSGSGEEYIPVALAMKDVVVVTINYRLSGFGFMTFGNDIVSGNMGLRDQQEALKWVKRFIHNFGGDPEKITIFGESAGAVSVHALHLSPRSSGLFSGAIAQSGTMLLKKTKPEMSREERNAKMIAEKFNCESTNYDSAMLKCLQNITAEEFLMNTMYVGINLAASQQERERSNWWPCVDSYSSDPILPVEPLVALKTGSFNKVPMMSGTVRNEGALQVMTLLGPAPDKETLWGYVGAQQLAITKSGNITETEDDEVYFAKVATKFYTADNYDLRETGQGWMDLFTDSSFLSPDQKMMELLVKQGNIAYNYHFDFSGNVSLAKLFGAPDSSLAPIHGDDLLYLFEEAADIRIQSEEELAISELMLNYWTNFAKYGTPTPFLDENLPQWKTYSQEKRYLEIKPKPEMKSLIQPERMLFWQRMLWDRREDEIDRWSLYQRMTNLFLGLAQ